MRKVFSVLMIIVILIGCCSCSGKGTGKSIHYPLSKSPSTLDPQYANEGEARIVINNIFEGLVRLKADGTVIPGIAESWDISSDGLTYNFKLKKGTEWFCPLSIKNEFGEEFHKKFSEATLTADDFVFAFRRAVDPATGSALAHRLFPIKNAAEIHSGAVPVESLGVYATDELTLVVELKEPCSDMLKRFSESVFMPCNEEFFNTMKGRYGLGVKYILCNGPFYLNAWDPETTMTVRANKYYSGEQKVLPSSVVFSFDSNENSILKKLSAGSLSAALLSPDSLVPENVKISAETENGIYGFVFNCSDTLTGNPNIRKALCASVDRELFMSEKYEDQKGLIPESCMAGEVNYRQTVGDRTPVIEFDRKNAKKLWENGLDELEKNRIELTVICTEEFESLVRKQIQVWQSVFGVSCVISVDVMEASEAKKAVSGGKYTVAFTGFESVFDEAADFCADLAANNIFRFYSDEYKAMANAIPNVEGSETLNACYTAETYLLQNAVCFPIYSRNSSFVVNKDVEGIEIFGIGSSISFINVQIHD